MSVLVITGTGTGVGKTVVTAAVAALARDRGADACAEASRRPQGDGRRDGGHARLRQDRDA